MKSFQAEQITQVSSSKLRMESGYGSSSSVNESLNRSESLSVSNCIQDPEVFSEDSTISTLASEIKILHSKLDQLKSENFFPFASEPRRVESNPSITTTEFQLESVSKNLECLDCNNKPDSFLTTSAHDSEQYSESRNSLNTSNDAQNFENNSDALSISTMSAEIKLLHSKIDKLNSVNFFSSTFMPKGSKPNSECIDYKMNPESPKSTTASKDETGKNVPIYHEACVNDPVNNALKIYGKLLTNQINDLRNLLIPLSDKDLDRPTLLFLYNNYLNPVDQKVQFLQESIREYISITCYDIEKALSATKLVEDATSWTSKLRGLFLSRGIFKKSQGYTLYSDLEKFSPNSTMDVYEFFRRFEGLTFDFDYVEEKAELLYGKYLSTVLQEEVETHKGDYEATKQFLIHKYGDPKDIVLALLKPLSTIPLPLDQSNIEHSHFYLRKLSSSMDKINSFLRPQFPYSKDFELFLYSKDFLHNLLNLVPKETKFDFFDKIIQDGIDTLNIKGKMSYELLLKTIHKHFEILSCLQLCQRSYKTLPDQKTKSVSSFSKNNPSINVSNLSNEGSDNKKFKGVSDIEYPCVLPGHNHSIIGCKEFFKTSTHNRVKARKVSSFTHCAVCLKSSSLCRGAKCSNFRLVPSVLRCRDCEALHASDNSRPCYSVLFCVTKSHHKPSDSVIYDALKSYIDQ